MALPAIKPAALRPNVQRQRVRLRILPPPNMQPRREEIVRKKTQKALIEVEKNNRRLMEARRKEKERAEREEVIFVLRKELGKVEAGIQLKTDMMVGLENGLKAMAFKKGNSRAREEIIRYRKMRMQLKR